MLLQPIQWFLPADDQDPGPDRETTTGRVVGIVLLVQHIHLTTTVTILITGQITIWISIWLGIRQQEMVWYRCKEKG